MSFRKLVMVSVLVAFLSVGLVFAIRYEFPSSNTAQTVPTSTSGDVEPVPTEAYLLIFAYSSGDGGFVQASVTVTGQYGFLNWTGQQTTVNNQTVSSGKFVYTTVTVGPFNGTTTTDLQNPLIIAVPRGGNYSVYGTYGSVSPQNMTVDLSSGSYGEAVLNFGTSPSPSLGHLIVQAWSNDVGGFVEASVTINGTESLSGTTHGSTSDALVFTVEPGVYTVIVTYGAAAPQSETVTVTAGDFAAAFFSFSSSSAS